MQKKILIDVDDEDIVRALSCNLTREGYAVRTVRSDEEAISEARGIPDLIILDIVLPGLDGWDVARRLKWERITSTIPIIYVTAKDSEIDEVVGLFEKTDKFGYISDTGTVCTQKPGTPSGRCPHPQDPRTTRRVCTSHRDR